MRRRLLMGIVGIITFYCLLFGSALLLDLSGWNTPPIGRIIGLTGYSMWFYQIFGWLLKT